MAGVGDVPPHPSRVTVLGHWQQEDEESFEKINTRPGKVRGTGHGAGGRAGGPGAAVPQHLCCHLSQIILFSEAGFTGHRREIWGDVPDATSWELSHTISIRVIRGG